MKYRKKPFVIDAVELKFSTDSQDEIIQWSNNTIQKGLDGGLRIPTLEGIMVANTGDYIIRGVKGEYYPCKPDIFEMTYELASTLPQQEISDEESQVFDTENLTVPIDARDEAFEILRHNIMIAPVDREYRIKLLTSLSNYIETLKP